MIRAAWLHRLYAAAQTQSLLGWTPPQLPAPKAAQEGDGGGEEDAPEMEPWQTLAEYERMLRHWRERRQDGAAGC